MGHATIDIKQRAVKLYTGTEMSYRKVGELLGVAESCVCDWVKRSRLGQSLDRANNPLAGRQPKIGQRGEEVLSILKNPASLYGYETDFWTTNRMQHVFKKELGLKVSRMAIWRFLQKYEFSYRKPEARYYHKSKEANTEEWSTKTVPSIKRTIKKHNAILYFEDESTISLSPSVAKTWAPRGEKTTRVVSPNRGSVSAISAISQSGNLLFNVHDGSKRFNAQDIVDFLSQMLKHHKRRHLVVVMDQAPCHTSKIVKDFVDSQKRLHIYYLPPRTPEFNPDEEVWNYLKNKKLKEHKAKSTKELKKLAKRKLADVAKQSELVKGIFRRSEGAKFFA